MNYSRRSGRILGILMLTAALMVLFSAGVRASYPGEPQPGTVRGLSGPHTFYAGSAAITQTTYTDSPRTVFGQESV